MSDPIVHKEIFEDEIYAWDQKFPPVYDQIPHEDDEIIEVSVFLEAISLGGLSDLNGYAYPMKDFKYAKGRNIGLYHEHVIFPSKCPNCIPRSATHIIWYSK